MNINNKMGQYSWFLKLLQDDTTMEDGRLAAKIARANGEKAIIGMPVSNFRYDVFFYLYQD
jgi:hypothetical protein